LNTKVEPLFVLVTEASVRRLITRKFRWNARRVGGGHGDGEGANRGGAVRGSRVECSGSSCFKKKKKKKKKKKNKKREKGMRGGGRVEGAQGWKNVTVVVRV
jgi:hypothetical protein